MHSNTLDIPVILGNVCSECVRFYSGQGATMPHGHSLQRGSPTVGALGDAALDENGRAVNRHIQVSRVSSNNITELV